MQVCIAFVFRDRNLNLLKDQVEFLPGNVLDPDLTLDLLLQELVQVPLQGLWILSWF